MKKFLGACAAMGLVLAALPASTGAHQHDRTQLAETRNASTCLSQRQACISAGTQTGQYGQRYVPPEVVRGCYDAYRACTKQR